MREHEVALQAREIGIGNTHRGELPETRVDAVDRLALADDRLDRSRSRLDGRPAALVERDGRPVIDRSPICERHGAGADGDYGGHRERPPLPACVPWPSPG